MFYLNAGGKEILFKPSCSFCCYYIVGIFIFTYVLISMKINLILPNPVVSVLVYVSNSNFTYVLLFE